jgi:pimeloyl-ACP methyl ester carboxylesterase
MTISVLVAEVTGSGPPVVLLHGQPGSRADWGPVARLLATTYTVVVPDRPGYGRTGGRATGFRANAEAVVALMDRLSLPRATIVGHSWGGGVALALAQDHPARVSGLVLLASVNPGHPLGAIDRALAIPPIGVVAAAATLWLAGQALSLPVVRQVIDRRLKIGTEESLAALAAAWRAGDVWRSFVIEQRALADELPALRPGLAGIAVPTTVVVGGADRIVPPAVGEALAASITGARLVRLDGARHLLAQEQPVRVAEEIRAIAGTPPGPFGLRGTE